MAKLSDGFWMENIKSIIAIKASDMPDKKRTAFLLELRSWIDGQLVPKELSGAKRTEAIKSFFRGMKRK